MTWKHPSWLLLVPLVLAAAAGAYRLLERRRAAWPMPDSASLRDLSPRLSSFLARALPYALRAAALVLCAAAMARPQAIRRQAAGLTEGIDIVLSLDTSTSMRALDFDPMDRMTAAKETAKRFVGGRVTDRIGLVNFGGAAVLSCPLTLDYDALQDVIADMDAGMTGVEGTAIGDGIAAGVNHLRGGRAPSKVLILLTDGRSNAGMIDPLTAAKAAASYGIKIYAIGTGKRGDTMIPIDDPLHGRVMARISDDIDEVTLTQVAEATGGKYFRATSFKELSQIYAEIDQMEKAPIERPKSVSYKDLYAWLLVPALFLLTAELALTRTLLLRIP
ncbi:MAG: VWA domain-containing protein [Elusimicrobia bacterium]|nr:VWA domain-containing protein [Elusimicrobiota bacterium]